MTIRIIARESTVVDMPMGEQHLHQSRARTGKRAVNLVEVAAGIDCHRFTASTANQK
jgi:hypothetical protein